MSRYAPKMSVDTLLNIIADHAIKHNYEEDMEKTIDRHSIDVERLVWHLTETSSMKKVLGDWSKVDFDLENCYIEKTNIMSSGIPYIVFRCGGDWQEPVYAIIYFDGMNLRGYVPKDGNTYDVKNKKAYDADVAYTPDFSKMFTDIENRIKVKGEYKYQQKVIISNAKIKEVNQKSKEVNLPKTGDLTNEHVVAEINLAAGCSYFTFKSKESGRKLNNNDQNRVVGIPSIFEKTTVANDVIWYSPDGYYPAQTYKILKDHGFEKCDETIINSVTTRIMYI